MRDKTQIGILKAINPNITDNPIACVKDIISVAMFGTVIGVILGVTTGYLSTGVSGDVLMATTSAIGFSIFNTRKLK